MRVNNIEISTYSAELLDRQASTTFINSITDWMDGAVDGIVLRQSYDFKSLKLTFLVTGENEDDAYKKISALTEALRQSEIKFDDIDLIFPCVLSGTSTPERVRNGIFKVTYILKNTWGLGDKVSLSFEIDPINAKEIELTYVENWANTIGYYIDCFDHDEVYQTIANETVWIDLSQVDTVAAADWDEFFLALGVDLNKYKPAENNTLNGFVAIDEEYSLERAKELFNEQDKFTIYYNRFHKDGYADIPGGLTYPSIVWTTGEENQYYFDLGVGTGWDIRDISIIVWGRWFNALSSTDTAANGSMFGSGTDSPFNLGLNVPNAVLYLDNITTQKQFEVFEGDTSGGQIIVETLESIAATPLRKYGFKSSNEGKNPIYGYTDIIFNGVTLDRVPIHPVTLTKNLTLLYGQLGTGKYCDASRVQIFYKGELIKDLIPIASNVKNCFYNDYDAGLYDINAMEFVPWSKLDGSKGQEPDKYMPLPTPGDTPQPPKPPVDSYVVVVNGGNGSGRYEAGSIVSISANPPTGYRFTEWTINSGTIILNTTQSSTSFVMPEEDVEVTAAFELIPIEAKILAYNSVSEIESETVMGENATVWSQSTSSGGDSIPTLYGDFVSVYSVPNNLVGSWSYYSSSNFTNKGKDLDKWGRPYAKWTVGSKSVCGQYIAYKHPETGEETKQEFCIKSLF